MKWQLLTHWMYIYISRSTSKNQKKKSHKISVSDNKITICINLFDTMVEIFHRDRHKKMSKKSPAFRVDEVPSIGCTCDFGSSIASVGPLSSHQLQGPQNGAVGESNNNRYGLFKCNQTISSNAYMYVIHVCIYVYMYSRWVFEQNVTKSCKGLNKMW